MDFLFFVLKNDFDWHKQYSRQRARPLGANQFSFKEAEHL